MKLGETVEGKTSLGFSYNVTFDVAEAYRVVIEEEGLGKAYPLKFWEEPTPELIELQYRAIRLQEKEQALLDEQKALQAEKDSYNTEVDTIKASLDKNTDVLHKLVIDSGSARSI
jgi:hypothetical protein